MSHKPRIQPCLQQGRIPVIIKRVQIGGFIFGIEAIFTSYENAIGADNSPRAFDMEVKLVYRSQIPIPAYD